MYKSSSPVQHFIDICFLAIFWFLLFNLPYHLVSRLQFWKPHSQVSNTHLLIGLFLNEFPM